MMKQYFIITVFLALIMSMSWAQSQITNTGQGLEDVSVYANISLIENNDEWLFFTNRLVYQKGEENVFYRQNKATGHVDHFKVGDVGQYNFAFCDDVNLNLYYAASKKKEKMLALYRTSIPISISKIKPVFNLYKSIPYDVTSEVKFHSATSPDRSKHCIVVDFSNKNEGLIGFYFIVLDHDGNIIWERNEPYKLSSAYTIPSTFISNEGNVSLMIETCNAKPSLIKLYDAYYYDPLVNDDKVKITTLQLFTATKANFWHFSQEIDFGNIHSYKAVMLNHNNFFIGGFYSTDHVKETAGYFSYLFNNQGEKLQSNIEPFNPNWVPESFVGYEQKAMSKNDFITRVVDIHELANGNVVMLSEQIYADKEFISDAGYPLYNYYVKNMMAQTFTQDGLFDKMLFVPRAQNFETVRLPLFYMDYTVTASSFCKGNDLYLLYNDHYDNYIVKPNTWLSLQEQQKNKSAVILTKISENEEIESQVVLKPQKKSCLLQSAFYHTDQDIYLILNKYPDIFSVETLIY
ncbi:MAG: hypothetical protein RR034_02555 [Bacteroidales bacterium]